MDLCHNHNTGSQRRHRTHIRANGAYRLGLITVNGMRKAEYQGVPRSSRSTRSYWYYEGFNIPNLNDSSDRRLAVRKRRLRHFLVDGQHGVIRLAADIDLGMSRQMPLVKLQVLDGVSCFRFASSTILMMLNISPPST